MKRFHSLRGSKFWKQKTPHIELGSTSGQIDFALGELGYQVSSWIVVRNFQSCFSRKLHHFPGQSEMHLLGECYGFLQSQIELLPFLNCIQTHRLHSLWTENEWITSIGILTSDDSFTVPSPSYGTEDEIK